MGHVIKCGIGVVCGGCRRGGVSLTTCAGVYIADCPIFFDGGFSYCLKAIDVSLLLLVLLLVCSCCLAAMLAASCGVPPLVPAWAALTQATPCVWHSYQATDTHWSEQRCDPGPAVKNTTCFFSPRTCHEQVDTQVYRPGLPVCLPV